MRKRNTVQREMVLSAIRQLRDHPTADRIAAEIHREHPQVGTGTVYRNLNSLSEDGEILRVSFPGEPDHFDHTLLPHYHALCVRCRRVFDVDMAPISGLEKQVTDSHGFEITGSEILFRGLCAECKKAATAQHGRPETLSPLPDGKTE